MYVIQQTFQNFGVEQDHLELDTEICRLWYSKENVQIFVKYSRANRNSQPFTFSLYCLWCIDEVKIMSETKYFFYLHSIYCSREFWFKIPCSNLTNSLIWYKAQILYDFLFLKVYQLLKQSINYYVSPWKALFDIQKLRVFVETN